MQQTFHRDRFTWLAYLSLAFYGYFLNVLGPITPFLKDELGLSYTVSSLHFTAFAVGILLIGVGGHLADSADRTLAFSVDRDDRHQSECPALIGRQKPDHHHRCFFSHGVDRFADPCHCPGGAF